jgi:thiol-disulfide isomerase/thioredoxin
MRILCLFFVFALAVLTASGCGGVKEEPIANTLAPELKEGEPAATVVLFSGAMVRGVEQQRRLFEMLRRRTNGRLSFKEVDVGTDRELGRMYAVRDVPRVILFDKDGKLAFYKIGVVTEAEIISQLNKLGVEVGPLPTPEGGTPPEQPEEPEKPTGEGESGESAQ